MAALALAEVTASSDPLKAPFPYFGGKSTVADRVWAALGDVKNYIEPFFGSGAVFLNRPHQHKTATLNDRDGYVCNFWRAVQADPDSVVRMVDYPVMENDLHARRNLCCPTGDLLIDENKNFRNFYMKNRLRAGFSTL